MERTGGGGPTCLNSRSCHHGEAKFNLTHRCRHLALPRNSESQSRCEIDIACALLHVRSDRVRVTMRVCSQIVCVPIPGNLVSQAANLSEEKIMKNSGEVHSSLGQQRQLAVLQASATCDRCSRTAGCRSGSAPGRHDLGRWARLASIGFSAGWAPILKSGRPSGGVTFSKALGVVAWVKCMRLWRWRIWWRW